MPDRFDGLKQLRIHLSALVGLRDRMDPDHVGRPAVEERIRECEAAIEAERLARA